MNMLSIIPGHRMKTIKDRNSLVEKHLTLAENLARRRFQTVHRSVQYGELLSAAYLGLLDAAEKFDASKANEQAKYPFRCYASARIQGEMNDYLRSCNWGTRNNHRAAFSIDYMPGYYDERGHAVTLRESLPTKDASAVDQLNSDELFDKLIRSLSGREKMIFKLRFIENLTMKQIADKIEISESRVSQILSQNTLFLEQVWRDQSHELWEEAEATQ